MAADLLAGVRNVAVGMLSPIPGAGALLARELSGHGQPGGVARTRVTILGSHAHNRFTNGGAELFDLAGRGRIGAFFLSGGQIDGPEFRCDGDGIEAGGSGGRGRISGRAGGDRSHGHDSERRKDKAKDRDRSADHRRTHQRQKTDDPPPRGCWERAIGSGSGGAHGRGHEPGQLAAKRTKRKLCHHMRGT